jgi:hypothetical protein
MPAAKYRATKRLDRMPAVTVEELDSQMKHTTLEMDKQEVEEEL